MNRRRQNDVVVSAYALIDPRTSEVRYVGVTGAPSARLGGHRHVSESRRSPKQEWVAELAAIDLQPGMIVLEEVPLSRWETTERRWIAYYRKAGARLTNITDGGDSPPGPRPPLEPRPRPAPSESLLNWRRLRERAREVAAGILGVPVEKVSLVVKGAPRAGRPRRVTDEEIEHALIASQGQIRPAARSLGVDESTIRARKKLPNARNSAFKR